MKDIVYKGHAIRKEQDHSKTVYRIVTMPSRSTGFVTLPTLALARAHIDRAVAKEHTTFSV